MWIRQMESKIINACFAHVPTQKKSSKKRETISSSFHSFNKSHVNQTTKIDLTLFSNSKTTFEP